MAQRVTLHVYDLSNGLARQFSQQFIGTHIEGIWHTGIVAFGREFFFGGGILSDEPGRTPYGTPVRSAELGDTHLTLDTFEEFLDGLRDRYTVHSYDLFNNNCNNFTNEASLFLTGKPIPEYISGLPLEFLSSPVGMMLKPIIEGFVSNAKQQHPMSFIPPTPQAQQVYGNNDVGITASNNSYTAPAHKHARFGSLSMVHSTQPVLFETWEPAKVLTKLQSVLPPTLVQSTQYASLRTTLEKRQTTAIPPDVYDLAEQLVSVLAGDNVFVAIDALRMLVLSKETNQFLCKNREGFLVELFKKYATAAATKASLIMALRLGANLFNTPEGHNLMINKHLSSTISMITAGLEYDDATVKLAGATLLYNTTVSIPKNNSDDMAQLVSLCVHHLTTPELHGELAFILLMSLGALLYCNDHAVEIAKVLEPNLTPFLNSSLQKVQNIAKEVKVLLYS
jgi:hypothetical protein